jgi:Tc toxin complex TcA C-terminal TcB-binding domain/Neuraminidase-like domain/Salmonella virulence plasmid 28.1kDa A protein
MDLATLRALPEAAGLPPDDVAVQVPELHARIQELRTDAIRDQLRDALASESPQLRAAVDGLDLSSVVGAGPDLPEAAAGALAAALGPGAVPPAALSAGLADLQRAGRLHDPVDPALPLAEQPLLATAFQQAELVRVADVIGIPDPAITAVLDLGVPVGAIERAQLSNLAAAGTLTRTDAAGLGLAVGLYNLTNGDTDVVRAVLPEIGGVRDLAQLPAVRWRETLAAAGAGPRPGPALDDFVDDLRRRVAALLPTDALFGQLIPRDMDRFRRELVAADKTRLEEVVRTFPGLGLETFLRDKPQQRAERIARRLGLLSRLRAANPDTELLALDLAPRSTDVEALTFADITDEERGSLLACLRSFQRVAQLTQDPALSQTLLAAGIRGSADVVALTPEDLATRAGIAPAAARQVHSRSTAAFGDVTAVVGSVVDAAAGRREWSAVANTAPDVEDYLKDIMGYADLFGAGASCRCDHCRSVLSPAAYFVDLMRLVESAVLDVYFTGTKATDELNLKVRRPDLWDLPLTCRNTNELVPTLEIVDEILEDNVARRTGYTGSLADRTAVAKAVYEQTLGVVKTGDPAPAYSFRHPFWLPMERLDVYLIHFGRSRLDVADALDATPATRTRATLQLSPPGYDLITQAHAGIAFLRAVYDTAFEVGPDGTVVPFDVQALLPPTQLDRDEVGALLATRVVAAAAAPGTIEIRPERIAPDSIQNDIERVHGLTPAALDVAHRFERLRARTPWSVAELDLLLEHGSATALDTTALDRVARLLRLQEATAAGVEELCALAGRLPVRPLSSDGTPLLDRLFNPAPSDRGAAALPRPGTTFLHPAFRPTAAPDPATAEVLHRLLAGLHVDDATLHQLIIGLADALGLDPESDDPDDMAFELSIDNLSLLHRHAWLAQGWSEPVPRVFRLIESAGAATGAVRGVDDLAAVLEFRSWLATSGYRLDDLLLVTGREVPDPSMFPDAATLAGGAVAAAGRDRALTFADTLFAFLPGVTEEHSRAIVTANPAWVTAVSPGILRLADAVDPGAPVTVPPEVLAAQPAPVRPLLAGAIRDLLALHHYSRVLPALLAGPLGTTPAVVAELLALAGTGPADAALAAALRGAGAVTALRDRIAAVIPLVVLFRPVVSDPDAVTFVGAHPDLFGAADFTGSVDLSVVRRLAGYAALAAAPDPAFATPAPLPLLSELHAVLLAFTTADGFTAVDPDVLARVLRVERGLAVTVRNAVPLPENAIDALAKLARCAGLARHLGVGGDALVLMVASDYASLGGAADAVLGAFRARYPDAAELTATLEPFEDRLRTLRRDALCDVLLHGLGLEFENRNDLYHHFLVDVASEGVLRTTRVASAISTVQLYIHRILVNLEQDRRDPADPAHIHVRPSAIPAVEWPWRRNYRVWEANRKVFLFPENYLEPELRDRTSPGFEKLQEDLLARTVTDAAVMDAYAGYLRGFDEVARLQIAGSWCDREADITHFVGVSATEPPLLYHRTAENLHRGLTDSAAPVLWDPWRPIELQVPARSVAPVVNAGRLHLFWVQYVTKTKTKVDGGTSTFTGYEHRLEVRYSTLGLNGAWTAPQLLRSTPSEGLFDLGVLGGIIADPLETGDVPRYSRPPVFQELAHAEPIDDYRLNGPNWDVFPETGDTVLLGGRNGGATGQVDFFANRITWLSNTGIAATSVPLLSSKRRSSDNPFASDLFTGVPPIGHLRPNIWANTVIDEARFQYWVRFSPPSVPGRPAKTDGLWQQRIATFDPRAELSTVGGASGDGIVQTQDEVLLVRPVYATAGATSYVVDWMSTTLADTLGYALFTRGLDGLLDTDFQLSLAERRSTLRAVGDRVVSVPDREPAYTGPNGIYLREVFHHIPTLIAGHLNGQGNYDGARRWYSYLFDPAASEHVLGDFRDTGCVAEDGDLHVVAVTGDGGIWLRRFRANGSWGPDSTDLKLVNNDPGDFVTADVATATDQLHVVGTDTTGRLWHTLQEANGSWQGFFGDASGAAGAVSRFVGTACAGDEAGLHVCAVGDDGRLWHSLRDRTSWTVLGDVVATAGGAPGAVAGVSCGMEGGRLHLCVLARDGALWHTERAMDGSWTVLQNVSAAGGNSPGPFVTAGCAVTPNGVHVVGATADGKTWITIGATDGAWGPFTDFGTTAGDAGRPRSMACAAAGLLLHVCGTGADGRLRHARTRPDGTWRSFDDGRQLERDRVWRYREFRGLEAPRLKDVLTDPAALEAYRRDPFNPHAIARLRLSAYQKSIVMKYIDNLIDWGDSLFAEFTTESVNEATLLYVLASDILGPRPVELGDCGVPGSPDLTYARIRSTPGSDFLVEVETLVRPGLPWAKTTPSDDVVISRQAVTAAEERLLDRPRGEAFRTDWLRPVTDSWLADTGTAGAADAAPVQGHALVGAADQVARFGLSLLRQFGPAFCVPGNQELRDYWNRVEDRLGKIRSGRDITGVRRDLAPFAPEIDPRALVRARAEGLSVEDALGVGSGNLPPYRFAYLIDRAKQHAAVVQAFGAALLSALEKKDAEELARLRAVHQQNLLTMATQSRAWEVESAQDAIDALTAQLSAAEYRKAHFEKLQGTGLTPWEQAQAAARHTASVIHGVEGLIGFLSGVLGLIPQLGSPFAMKYGGVELKNASQMFHHAIGSAAKAAEAIAASAGLEAGFERRKEGWDHQVELAGHELAVLQVQIAAATRRKQIAAEALALHLRSIGQAEEVFDLYRSKFSGLGRYTQLARSAQRLYREAFNGAYAIAQLAEQALRTERDDVQVSLGSGQWDAATAGLLAGERLTTGLLALERAYLETNYRGLEIDQAFSLAQIDPAALVQLRQTGECTFEIPEAFFDVFYPGHYRRRIRAVRLTIPAITGPYVNVSATLTLLDSFIRMNPALGTANLQPVPRRRTVSIATSSAQADSGVFEMSFRDERYMPFEGQGAVRSRWQLSLPRTFAPFDLQSINDVILSISYTAAEDGALRLEVERESTASPGAIQSWFKGNSTGRVFSLRQDFSAAFHRLLHSPARTPIQFEITGQYFPAFLGNRPLTVSVATLALRPRPGQTVAGTRLTFNSVPLTSFSASARLGQLPGVDLAAAAFPSGIAAQHTIQIDAAGDLALQNPAPGDTSIVDEAKLQDILIYVEYRLA